MGRYNLFGTPANQADPLPKDTGADEKHGAISGERVYIATTVAEQGCWGASVSVGADEENLTAAYGQFQREAQQVQPDYPPETVNTDSWQATMNAWRTLCPSRCLIQCFLHAILGIRNVATKAARALYDEIVEQAWKAYRAAAKRQFSQRVRRLRDWGGSPERRPLKSQTGEALSENSGLPSRV